MLTTTPLNTLILMGEIAQYIIGAIAGLFWPEVAYAPASPEETYNDPTEKALFVGSLMPIGGGTKAVSNVTRNFADDAAKNFNKLSLPDSTLVCRGGTCSAERFTNGTGVIQNVDGTLSGVSVTTKVGASEQELVRNLPGNYGKYGLTTVGEIKKFGGEIVKDTISNYHGTLNNLTAQQLESLFTPIRSVKDIFK